MWWIVLLNQLFPEKEWSFSLTCLSFLRVLFLGISLKPNLTSENPGFFTWPGILYMFFLNVHNTNKMLISERYFESCRRGQMVGTKKTSPSPERMTQTNNQYHQNFWLSPLTISSIRRFTLSTGPLCVSHWHSRWWSGSLLTSPREKFRPIVGHSKGWFVKGSHPQKMLPRNWGLGIIFVYDWVFPKKKGVPNNSRFSIIYKPRKKSVFFPYLFFLKTPI